MGPDHEVLYSRERALVRVHGVECAIPNGDRTLIVLVDETVPDVLGSIKTQTAPAPTSPWSRVDPHTDNDERKRLRIEEHRAASAVWRTWLEKEQFIAAFVRRAE